MTADEVPSIAAARAVLSGLLGAGVRDVVLCPGSRSAPLAYLLAAAEDEGLVRLHVRHDERSAAFVALGCGLADPAHPAAVVTTSGTAAANLLPAVAEAHHAGVPLIVLTADRPHRLRHTWANQTSDAQVGFLQAVVRAVADVDTAHQDGPGQDGPGQGDLVDLAAHVVAVARGLALSPLLCAHAEIPGRAGPVHLNLCFDDPLTPPPGLPIAAPAPEPRPVPTVGPATAPGSRSTPSELPTRSIDGEGTVVVAGSGAGAAARTFAEAAGLPLLAEPASGSCTGPNVVRGYRLLLARPGLRERIRRVVVFGRPTLSRPVAALIADPEVEVVHVLNHPADPGPARDTQRVAGVTPGAPADPVWLTGWVEAGQRAGLALDEVIRTWRHASGPALAARLGDELADGDVLVLASSNPIRDVDLVADDLPEGALVLANRGLAGIDGTISTAIGVAAATGRPTRLLIGDLAFLHDAGGLAVPERELDRISLQVLVLDDEGGGLFHLLEHGDHRGQDGSGPFERVFGTDPEVDLKLLAAAFATPVMDYDPRVGPLPLVEPGLLVVHTPAERAQLRALHQAIGAAVERSGSSGSAAGEPGPTT